MIEQVAGSAGDGGFGYGVVDEGDTGVAKLNGLSVVGDRDGDRLRVGCAVDIYRCDRDIDSVAIDLAGTLSLSDYRILERLFARR